MSLDFTYQCVNCSKEIQTEELIYLCPDCSVDNTPEIPPKGVLKIIYDYDTIIKDYGGGDFFYDLKNVGFIDLLPINSIDSLPGLKIGNTPLYEMDQFDGKSLNGYLYLKDDSQNPTFSFKDRASALVSAYAKENRIKTIVTASTGNAGCSMAGICAAQGQHSVIIVPAKAPKEKILQIMMYGAHLIPVRGNYDDAFELSIKLSNETGYYNRNTAYNPLTVEGKKTAAFEIFDQLDGFVPDNIFVPVGDGVIISGMYKGFEDLLLLGLSKKMPTIYAVQADGSSNLVNNLTSTKFKLKSAKTIADSICVDVPRNFYMTQKFLGKYAGKAMIVSDREIIEASQKLAKNTGIFAEPAAATAFAGYLKFGQEFKADEGVTNLVMLTGSGLKDLSALTDLVKLPKSLPCDIEEVKKSLLL